MNFFRLRDGLKKPIDSDEECGSTEPSVAELAEDSSFDVGGLDDSDNARGWSEEEVIDAFDEAQDSLPAEDTPDDEPAPGEDDEPFVGEEPMQDVDVEPDAEPTPTPFEARLARLRQQLQDGPRLIPDASVPMTVEPEPTEEPQVPEPAEAFEPSFDAKVHLDLGLAHEALPPAAAADETQQSGTHSEVELPPVPIVSEPPVGLPARRAGRVKTRLLGFERGDSLSTDPLGSAAKAESSGRFPVGWIVVVKGPGRGASFCLYNGLSQIGRGSDQAVCLDFGDTSISRENHAVVAYDSEQKRHFLGHGGKANIVRLNDMPVLSTEVLSHGDQIRIGETTLRFVALCGDGFDWSMTATDDDFDAAAI
jgi:hypothetical protein